MNELNVRAFSGWAEYLDRGEQQLHCNHSVISVHDVAPDGKIFLYICTDMIMAFLPTCLHETTRTLYGPMVQEGQEEQSFVLFMARSTLQSMLSVGDQGVDEQVTDYHQACSTF